MISLNQLYDFMQKENYVSWRLSFQRRLEERYSSEWLRQLFEQHGSVLRYISTDEPKSVEDTKNDAVGILEGFTKP